MPRTMSGCCSRASARLVCGPSSTMVWLLGWAAERISISASTAGPRLPFGPSGMVAPPMPFCPWMSSIVLHVPASGFSAPRKTGICGLPARAISADALRVVRLMPTLPATVVIARTSTSGDAQARKMASASSIPGSVSMMIDRLPATGTRPPCAAPGSKVGGKILAGVGGRRFRHLLRRARCHHAAALVAALGAEVDDPVSSLDDFEIVLDDDHGVPLVHQLMQHFEKLSHIFEMQASGRFVQDIEGAAGRPAGQLLGQLHALRLAAGQRCRGLADMDVAEADLLQHRQLVADRRDGAEELDAFLNRHLKDIGNRLAFESYFQGLAVVALALALVALDIDVGQEVHLDLDDAVALAGLAAAALHVEGEAARLVAARLGFGQAGEPVADRRESAGVGRRIRARGAADRGLVDVDDLVEVFDALDLVMIARMQARIVQAAGEGVVERLDHQRGLAAAGDAGHASEDTEWDVDRDVLEVVVARADDLDLGLVAEARAARARHRDLAP